MKKRRVYIFFILIVFSAVLFSCSHDNTALVPNIRTFIQSEGLGIVEINIYIEGVDGNSLTGAFVAVSTDSLSYTYMKYSPEECCYKGSMQGTSCNKYYFIVDSILFQNRVTFSIQHEQLTDKPVVSVLSDAAGNSGLNGEELNADLPIQICWTQPSSNCTYIVSIRTATETVYSVSTQNSTVYLPPETLSNGLNYYVKIQAQKSYGDILYNKENYYSVNVLDSINLGFSCEE